MHRGGAAHAQDRLCARITERLTKILKIFTRNTESTVDGLGALTDHAVGVITDSCHLVHA